MHGNTYPSFSISSYLLLIIQSKAISNINPKQFNRSGFPIPRNGVSQLLFIPYASAESEEKYTEKVRSEMSKWGTKSVKGAIAMCSASI